jgi:hypothetical protein
MIVKINNSYQLLETYVTIWGVWRGVWKGALVLCFQEVAQHLSCFLIGIESNHSSHTQISVLGFYSCDLK